MSTTQENQLAKIATLPDFANFNPEDVEPAIEIVLERTRQRIAALLNAEVYTWQNTLLPIETDQEFTVLWGAVSMMNAVLDNDQLRDAYERCVPKVSAFFTELGQSEKLYQAYLSVSESQEFPSLDEAAQKVVQNSLLNFQLSGIALAPAQRERFAGVKSELSVLQTQFGRNLTEDTKAWSKVVQLDDLRGLSQRVIDTALAKAQSQEIEGYLLTLDMPTYVAVISYADDENLRREYYHAYTTRCSDQGFNAQFDNTEIMTKIMTLRQEQAQLLGFENFATLALQKRMAKSTSAIIALIDQIAAIAVPKAKQELADLAKFAKEQFNASLNADGTLDSWNIAYYSEKLKATNFQISDEELRDYFPVERVLQGLFEITKRLFGVSIKSRKTGVSLWSEARFFDIFNSDGSLRGSFYLDLYSRTGKHGGAWMEQCISRSQASPDSAVTLPVVYLVTNAAAPSGDKPGLLSHREVQTLFHEFGHGLHGMLTTVAIPSVAGTNGVLWDGVELPSQLMENWVWQPQSLPLISSHYLTGEPLPDELLTRMLAARNFQSALQTVRQLEFALFDILLHMNSGPFDSELIRSVLNQARSKVAAIQPPSYNRFENAFSHIFLGDYAAGYYSYMWALVLAADAFSAFEESSVFDADTGARLRDIIFSNGGSRDMNELFNEFRGREPSIDSLLRHSGLTD